MMIAKVPLPLVPAGTEVRIAEIHAGEGMYRRFTAMGISPESLITVICADRGSLIIMAAGARYALSKGMAMKIYVADPAVPAGKQNAGA
jgi:ferrous iron transport protein A